MRKLWYGFIEKQIRTRNHRKEMRINRKVLYA